MSQQSRSVLTVSQALVRYLSAQYSTRDGNSIRLIPGFLGIFGHGNTGGIGQALDEHRGEMFFIEGRNEQGMAHTAAAYAKQMRRESTLACTTSIGPGSTNMITAAAGAYINRLPVLLLPADTYATRRQGTILQGLENPAAADLSVNDCFRPVARFFDRITRPEQLLDSLPRAMRTLTDPVEVGPVVISLPQDVQVEAFAFPTSFFEPRHWSIARPAAEAGALQSAAERIKAAKRPVIVAGGGVFYSRAEAELLELSRRARIPVVETFAGKGLMPSDNELALGGLGVGGTTAANAVARAADLVLCAGTRLSDFVTGSQSVFQNPDVQFVGLNINPADANKYGALPVVGDLRETLHELVRMLADMSSTTSYHYEGEIAKVKSDWKGIRARALDAEAAPPLRQSEAVGVLNEVAQPGDTLVTSAGTLPGDVMRFWEREDDKKCHIEFGNSCMGYDIAGAIGVRLAQPEGEVFALLGDATFILSPSDVAVAVQHHLKITVVVCDNHGMRSIRGLEGSLVARPFANIFDFRDPQTYATGDAVHFDIGRIGEGLGACVYRATTKEELSDALAAARAEDRSCLIVVTVDNGRTTTGSDVWWDIAPAEVSQHADVSQLRSAYERRREEQRFHYWSTEVK